MNKEKHIIQKIMETPILNVNPIERDTDYMVHPEIRFKVSGAKDILHYNRLNDIINTPSEGMTDDELITLKAALAQKIGCKLEDLNPYNKEGWLRGTYERTITVDKSGLVLRPTKNYQDILKALILISNDKMVVRGKEQINTNPTASYLITVPNDVQSEQADIFKLQSEFYGAIATLTDDLAKTQAVIEIFNYSINSPIRMAENQSRVVIESRLSEISKDINNCKRFLNVIKDSDLESKIEIINYLSKGFIKYRTGKGFELEGTETTPGTFQELCNFLATPTNANISSALKGKYIAYNAQIKMDNAPAKKGRPAKTEA